MRKLKEERASFLRRGFAHSLARQWAASRRPDCAGSSRDRSFFSQNFVEISEVGLALSRIYRLFNEIMLSLGDADYQFLCLSTIPAVANLLSLRWRLLQEDLRLRIRCNLEGNRTTHRLRRYDGRYQTPMRAPLRIQRT